MKMKINTSRFGEVDIKDADIIHMPYGMLGFPEFKRYIILHHRSDSPFFWYQSADDPELAFVMTDPFLFVSDYGVELDQVIKDMAWKDLLEEYLELYAIVNIPKNEPEKMTANLIGPILINNKERQAVQMVLSNSPYSHKHPLVSKE